MGDFEREVYRSTELIEARGAHVARTRYRCVTPGVRMPRRDGDPPDVGDLATAILALYPDAVLGGWTAARLYRHTMADSRTAVEVICPRPIRRAGVIRRGALLEECEIRERYGLAVTSPERMAIDLARYTPGDEAIAAMDQCLRNQRRGPRAITTREAIEAELDRRQWWRGERVRRVLAESDGRSESPWETFARLALHRAGLRMFEPQVPEGEYWIDLGDRRTRVAVEYDGSDHLSARQKAADETRRNELADMGWRIIVATAPLIRNRPELLRLTVNALRERGCDPYA